MIPCQQSMMLDTALAFEQAIKNPMCKTGSKHKKEGSVEVRIMIAISVNVLYLYSQCTVHHSKTPPMYKHLC